MRKSLFTSRPQGAINFAGGASSYGTHTFTKREFFKQVIAPVITLGGSGQSIQQFEVNIGLDEMFPWGSQIGNNFKKYKLVQLAFHYEPQIVENSLTGGNGQVGQLTMAWNPDAGTFDNTTQVQLMNDETAATELATRPNYIGAELDRARGGPNGFLYVRNAKLRPGQQIQDYDPGALVIGLSGFPSALSGCSIGKLYVSYTVQCAQEQVNTSMGDSIDTDLWAIPGTAVARALVSDVWNSTSKASSLNNIGTTISGTTPAVNNQLLTVSFPASAQGFYEIRMVLATPTLAADTIFASVNAGSSFINTVNFNNTAAPVFDLLGPGLGLTAYTDFTVVQNACPAPTGSAVLQPGAPYCFAQLYGTDSNVAGQLPYMLTFTAHVYIPGVTVVGTGGASPINIGFNINYGVDATLTAALLRASCIVTVTEYNSTMRSRLDGANDAPILSTVLGQVPTQYTTATWQP
nr:putative capsid protein [Crucivirus sp.]